MLHFVSFHPPSYPSQKNSSNKSSAPENREHVTLHIRGVGQWTNRLFDYVEAKKKEEGLIVRQNTVRNKVKNLKNEDRHNGHPVEQTNGKMHLDMTFSDARPIEQKQDPKDMMEVNFDGPFGAPATNIFRAEHAVLGTLLLKILYLQFGYSEKATKIWPIFHLLFDATK
jgi:hypothetical protein